MVAGRDKKMVVDADQPKTVVERKVIDTKDEFSLELVEFKTNDGPAFGCRVFSEYQNGISDLFDERDEALAIGRVLLRRA